MRPKIGEVLLRSLPAHIVTALVAGGVALLVLPAAAISAEVQATKSRVWGPSSRLEGSQRVAEPTALQSRVVRRRDSERLALRGTLARSSAAIQTQPGRLVAEDEIGDTFGSGPVQIDVDVMATDTDHNSLFIDLIFTTFVSEPDSGLSDAVTGFVDIDTDQNPETGVSFVAAWGLGADFTVDLNTYDSLFGDAAVVDAVTDETVDFVPVTFFGDGLLIKIPLSVLSDDGFVDIGAEMGTLDESTDIVPNAGFLESDDTAVRLNGDRFWVIVDWVDFESNEGPGHVVPFRSDDSGMLWFFNENNWEILIKLLRGCPINDRYWVFAAATTDVEYELFVYDVFTGASVSYFNTLGVASPAITDTDAFATCP